MVKNFSLIYLFILFYFIYPVFPFHDFAFFWDHPFPASPAPRKAEALFLLEGCFFVPPAMKVWLCWLVGLYVRRAYLCLAYVTVQLVGLLMLPLE